ncbi:MAG: hypothetical protein KBE23_06500 [Chloroflexi bacterium]|nr:hypothetical protein [Chloroflexota bacterium]MBP7042375.1 hypothetical protein [Chloroflexota bacterium]
MKSGYKTTEFWLTAVVNIAAAVVAILAARGLLSNQEGELWLALVQAIAVAVAPLVMGAVTAVYTQSRAKVKAADPRIIEIFDAVEAAE